MSLCDSATIDLSLSTFPSSGNQIVLVLVLVLVLDPKRISRSAACTSGDFEIGTGFPFGQPYQPFEHEYEHEKILAECVESGRALVECFERRRS
jgi:hypothetical protein